MNISDATPGDKIVITCRRSGCGKEAKAELWWGGIGFPPGWRLLPETRTHGKREREKWCAYFICPECAKHDDTCPECSAPEPKAIPRRDCYSVYPAYNVCEGWPRKIYTEDGLQQAILDALDASPISEAVVKVI